MTGAVTVDIAGAQMGGAARFAGELRSYLARTGRQDVTVIGVGHRVEPRWLLRRELMARRGGRRIAMNNVGFVGPGGERWTLLRNALHFLSDDEAVRLDPATRVAAAREAAVVRRVARRSDVLVVPCGAMAERVTGVLPKVRGRIVVRSHPVSVPEADPAVGAVAGAEAGGAPVIFCPVLFSPYKRMPERLADLLVATRDWAAPVVIRVTAEPGEVGGELADHSRVEMVGRIGAGDVRRLWDRCRAIYFPCSVESFGYPLAEARVRGLPVIAGETEQNREIAGKSLCGFAPGDPQSLRDAVERALSAHLQPDPGAFDPDAYFDWMLGSSS